MTARTLRIGNSQAFWGDRLDATAELLQQAPDLDVVTLDFLAEVSLSILAVQKDRDPNAGYCRDFVDVVRSLVGYWKAGGTCRLITNAGGLNPQACALACQALLKEMECDWLRIAVVSGDDVLTTLQDDHRAGVGDPRYRHLDSGSPIGTVIHRLTTANAYLGARPIVDALRLGADLVITGRVADPSLVVAPCVDHFDWSWNDWDRLAGATVAGHLIECGTQVTGGISTDWCSVPNVERIGFPIVEVDDEGSCVVTKASGSGGRVTEATVKEQLLYEIGDPRAYLSPDVTVSFLSLEVREDGVDRVHVKGAQGRRPSSSLKVSATYRDGYRAAGQLTIFGDRAVAKAHRAAQVVLDQLADRGVTFQQVRVQCIGAGACLLTRPDPSDDGSLETVLRISVSDQSRAAVEQFSKHLMSLVTAGPPGTTCYADGRPRVHPHFAYWPCLIDEPRVIPRVEMLPYTFRPDLPVMRQAASQMPKNPAKSRAEGESAVVATPRRLADIAYARSGDKGPNANIGVIARDPAYFEQLLALLTPDRVGSFLGIPTSSVTRYELPSLHAVNLVLHGVLDTLRVDAQGKALGQLLLTMPVCDDK